jgi:hypothetical protein
MLLARRDPDDITRIDSLNLAAPLLDQAGPGGDDQRLTGWMSVPCRPRAGLEGDTRAGCA